ncbi:MAG: NAD-dependent epimerase/dehydratase family protein [Anaerolineae bacterium]|nr:NAD-dependent epimerase/dehydratase family protein [Anaerolineae bacterium]
MRALVIGGNGFIGSHLVDALSARGWKVTVYDLYERRYDPLPPQVRYIKGDLSQTYLLRQAVTETDVVFHLAWATIHEVANNDPTGDITANLIPSLHLIEICRQVGVRRLVFMSSGGTVYGPTDNLPISETHPQHPITAYGITKLAVEKYLQMFHHLYDLDYAILRPSVPFGPRQNPLARQGVVSVFLYRISRDLPITIWGDGSVTRDYFYISDLTNAIIAVAESEILNHRVFNIGGGQEISLLQLLELVEEVIGKKGKVNSAPARKFDIPRLLLDTQLATQELAWQPQVFMKQGIVQTWQWMSGIEFPD